MASSILNSLGSFLSGDVGVENNVQTGTTFRYRSRTETLQEGGGIDLVGRVGETREDMEKHIMPQLLHIRALEMEMQ